MVKWLEIFVYYIVRACNMYNQIIFYSKLTSDNSNSKGLKTKLKMEGALKKKT